MCKPHPPVTKVLQVWHPALVVYDRFAVWVHTYIHVCKHNIDLVQHSCFLFAPGNVVREQSTLARDHPFQCWNYTSREGRRCFTLSTSSPLTWEKWIKNSHFWKRHVKRRVTVLHAVSVHCLAPPISMLTLKGHSECSKRLRFCTPSPR